MVLKGKRLKAVDPLHPTELGDLQLDQGLSKVCTVEIQVSALDIPILRPGFCFLLLAEVILDTSRPLCTKASGVYKAVWLEEGPEQVVSDLATL
jgi:hypothetical protein